MITWVEHIIPIVKFKTAMLMSCLYDYIDGYKRVKGTVPNTAATGVATSNANKKVIYEN